MKSTIMFVAALGLVLISACGDDDSGAATESPDAGSRNDSGAGSSGRGGSSSAGRGGSTATAGSGGRADGSAGSSTTEDAGSTPVSDAAMPADGGDSGTGTSPDAAASDAGGVIEPDPGCAGLEECCAVLPEAQRMSCQLIADNADDALCTDFQPLLCAPPVDDKKACKTLDACCESLPRGSLKVSCAMTVMAGAPLACQQSAIAFCLSEGGDPNVCEALSECCESLTPPQRASCNMVVAQALPGACETVRAALCP